MFERFTQRTVDIIASAQNLAQDLKHNVVYSEHLLLALLKAPKGVETKIFQMAGVDSDELEMIILRNSGPISVGLEILDNKRIREVF